MFLRLGAQEYRISYDAGQLPELYPQVTVYAEEKKGDRFVAMSSNTYRLHTSEGSLKGQELRFDRELLYRNKGIIHFTIKTKGKEYPAILTLPILDDIRFNLYTDSIKPVLNYWVNVEGVFSNGKILPLDTSFVTITSDQSHMNGMEWVLPSQRDFDKVTFSVVSKNGLPVKKEKTLYLKKHKDPRDAPDYRDKTEQEIIHE